MSGSVIEYMRFPTENAFKSHTKFRAVKEISESFENMMQIMECTQDWINGNLPIPDFSPFCWYCQNCIRDEGFFLQILQKNTLKITCKCSHLKVFKVISH